MPYATISPTNSKLGRIPNISLSPIQTCCSDAPCRRDCYAMQAYRLYPAAQRAWDRNLKNWKDDSRRYFDSILGQIVEKRYRFFRWHVGGDIPSVEYLDEMVQIAKAVPTCKFLCFTKRYSWVVGKRFPKNFTMVLSGWPGYPMPRTCKPKAWMRDERQPDRRIKNAIECPGGCANCGMCWNLPALGKNVVFEYHQGWLASVRARQAKKTS